MIGMGKNISKLENKELSDTDKITNIVVKASTYSVAQVLTVLNNKSFKW